MHSPIFYAIETADPKHVPSAENLREILPDEDAFISATPLSDWCQMDTSVDGWHRGQLDPDDIQQLLASEPHYTVTKHDDEWFKVVIDKATFINHARYRLKVKRDFLDVVEKGLDLDMLIETFAPQSDTSPFTKAEHDITMEHFRLFDDFGGVRFALYTPFDHMPGQPLGFSEFCSMRDIDTSITWRLDDKTDTYTFYVSAVVTGDYHF